jgi:hypothetical protein
MVPFTIALFTGNFLISLTLTSLTSEEIDLWRENLHRQYVTRIDTRADLLRYIKQVGFCFMSGSEHGDSPTLLAALREGGLASARDGMDGVRFELRRLLPPGAKVYFARYLKGRPTVIAPEFVTYFFALSGRSGAPDDHAREHRKGELSAAAAAIVDALTEESPQSTLALRLTSGMSGKSDKKKFEHAVLELQKKMFVVQLSGTVAEAEWDLVIKRFAREAGKSHAISEDNARATVLAKYCQNQLVVSAPAIQKLFAWDKQTIYRALGQLRKDGIITPDVKVDGKSGGYYAYVH